MYRQGARSDVIVVDGVCQKWSTSPRRTRDSGIACGGRPIGGFNASRLDPYVSTIGANTAARVNPVPVQSSRACDGENWIGGVAIDPATPASNGCHENEWSRFTPRMRLPVSRFAYELVAKNRSRVFEFVSALGVHSMKPESEGLARKMGMFAAVRLLNPAPVTPPELHGMITDRMGPDWSSVPRA